MDFWPKLVLLQFVVSKARLYFKLTFPPSKSIKFCSQLLKTQSTQNLLDRQTKKEKLTICFWKKTHQLNAALTNSSVQAFWQLLNEVVRIGLQSQPNYKLNQNSPSIDIALHLHVLRAHCQAGYFLQECRQTRPVPQNHNVQTLLNKRLPGSQHRLSRVICTHLTLANRSHPMKLCLELDHRNASTN